MAKSKKFDFKKIAISTITAGATGVIGNALYGVAAKPKSDTDTTPMVEAKMVDLAMILGGAILPEFVKNEMVNTASTALIAVGAYKYAERTELNKTLGIDDSPKVVTGLTDFRNIGATAWKPNYAKKESKTAGSSSNIQ